MMRATMDLIALYNYDNSLLDNLVIPAELDKQILVDNLLMESAEMEVVYSSFAFMKAAIGSWSNKMLHVWEELYATTQYEYNPIWNKDGTIDETITRDLAATEDVSDDNTRTNDLTQTNNLASTNDVTTTDSVYGFNSSTDAPAGKQVIDQDGSNTGTVTNTGTVSDARTIDRDTTDTGTITTSRTEQGNIGVTSTQQLIKEQREVVQLNLYDVIIQDFIDRFCLKIY